jgi:trans-2,3-dihydro-3-hydroxyanthranilate isomerase
MHRRYLTADVFTDQAFVGNPLAIVLDAADLSTAQMQLIAREFKYAETTFVLPPIDAEHTARVRIFSPGAELPFAGHPNIGTAFALARLARREGRDLGPVVRFEEGAGLVPVALLEEDGQIVGAELTAPEPLSLRSTVAVDDVAACLSLSRDDIETVRHQPQVVSVGLPFLVAELASRDALRRAADRPDRIAALLPLDDANAIYCYTYDVPPDEGPLDWQARMFSPLDGTGEDPATGSATVATAALLADIAPGAAGDFAWRVGQGYDLGRPSLLLPRVEKRGGRVERARIGGRCVEVMTGTFELAGDA